jgi:ubiquinone/menaquinone biosynthesis C-methylase UbiE
MIIKLMRKLWGVESVALAGLTLVYLISKIFDPPKRFIRPFVKEDYVAADLGCATGYYTFALADFVGPEGKVYAVDFNKKSIRALEKKAKKGGYHNIESHASSASDLSFIKDSSVDFVLASGLL